MKFNSRKRIADIVYIAMCTALMCICSLITIPFAVPFTLQTFAVFFSLLLLGGKRGALSICAYIGLGLAGMPVFSGFMGGVAVIFGATGGYLIGFILAALIYLAAEKLFGERKVVSLLSISLGLLACYIFGSIWFMVLYIKNTGEIAFWTVLAQCVLPFVIPDVLKICLAFLLDKRLKKYIR